MKWWDKLSNIGVNGQQDIQLIRHIHILNRTLFLTCFFLSFYVPFNIILHNYFYAITETIFLLLTIFAYYFYHKNWFRFSTYYIFILLIINMTFAMVIQNNISLESLMISGSIGGFVMFKKKRDSFIVLILFIFAYALGQFLKFHITPMIEYDESERIIFSYTNILIAFLVIGAVILNFKSVLENYENTLLDQKSKIDEHNKEITDSIKYAKRIQLAQLPETKEIFDTFPQSFVLYKPKDIVSGDFYSFHKNENQVFIAAADCTGHGVPGALMSMLSSEKLHDAFLQYDDVSEILTQVNKGIKFALRQSESSESTRDGMDIALCSFDFKTKILTFVGANRPLWLIRKGELEEIKANRVALGGLTEDDQEFLSHHLHLEEGDTFYIFTDGYSDQFNGKTGKKIMTKKFKQVLVEIQHFSMIEQEIYLNNFIAKWRDQAEQVDDILVIGIRM